MYFASPASAAPVSLLPDGSVTVKVCAAKAWVTQYVKVGALWPSPPYKVILQWEAKKWTWAAPATLPVATQLNADPSGNFCTPPIVLHHPDFPVQDLWRVTARVQFDKGVKSGGIERYVRVLPPRLKQAPPGNAVAKPITVPATRN